LNRSVRDQVEGVGGFASPEQLVATFGDDQARAIREQVDVERRGSGEDLRIPDDAVPFGSTRPFGHQAQMRRRRVVGR
jgi:hypothetical protein